MYIDLQSRLRFFDNLLDLMPVEVAVRDVEGHYTLVNRAWESSAGLRREQVLGRTAFDLFPHGRAQSIDSTDREALALGGKTLYSDFHVRGSDGAERYLSVSKTAMLDGNGKAVGVLSTATDVTARREAEQALKEQIKLTRDLIEAKAVLERLRRGDAASTGAGDAPAEPGAAPLMNWSRLEEIRECDPRGGLLVRKVVGTFVREGRTRVAAIGHAAGRRDAAALASAAHALKGAALNVGAAQLAELCADLEAWGRENRTDRAAASTALLRQRFRETARALETEMSAPARRRGKTSGVRRTVKQKPGAVRRKR